MKLNEEVSEAMAHLVLTWSSKMITQNQRACSSEIFKAIIQEARIVQAI